MAQAMITPQKKESMITPQTDEQSAEIKEDPAEDTGVPAYFKTRSAVLTTNEVVFIMNNPNIERTTNQMPFQPQGGEVYVFIANGICTQEDWRTDGYSWVNQGTKKLPNKNPQYRKTYCYIKTEDSHTNKFRKDIYRPLLDNNITIIHYLGNEKLAVDKPHGNSFNPNKIFFRTKPSTIATVKRKVLFSEAHQVYKEVVREPAEGNQTTTLPRNPKQVQNYRHSAKQADRLTRDEFINTLVMSYETPNFVHEFRPYPHLSVIAGRSEILDELQKYGVNSPSNLTKPLLSYDTTFRLGDFYVSVLLFRHLAFTEKPVIPGLFLVHDLKVQTLHENLFRTFSNKVKVNGIVPIVTDFEIGILNSIEKESNLTHVGCWNHAIGDIKLWVQKHGGTSDDKTFYVDEVKVLLQSQTSDLYMSVYTEKVKKWSDEEPHISLNSTMTELEVLEIENGIEAALWINSREGVKLNLSVLDKAIIEGTGGCPSGWLNDTIIDGSMSLLKKQFPLAGGLQSCLLAQRPCFSTPLESFVQIINLDPRGRGVHWLALSNFNCRKGVVQIYDSAHLNRVSVHIEKCIAQLANTQGINRLTIMWMECDKQRNTSACGIFAIANIVALLFQRDPLSISFDVKEMRPHLLACLEKGELTPFPVKRAKRKRASLSGQYHTLLFQLVCSCKMPSGDGSFQFECTVCKKFFHPKCQGITLSPHQIYKAKHLPCLSCKPATN